MVPHPYDKRHRLKWMIHLFCGISVSMPEQNLQPNNMVPYHPKPAHFSKLFENEKRPNNFVG